MDGLILSGAGMLGAAGVMVSAAAAHLAGGGPAGTAGTFLLLHAAALAGLAGLSGGRRRTAALAAVLLGIGTMLFAGELALAGLWSWRPVPLAAPVGGVLMILGWLVLPLAGLAAAFRRGAGRRPRPGGGLEPSA